MTARGPSLPPPGSNALFALDMTGFVWKTAMAPGQLRWAALGFVKLVRRILRDHRPAALAVCRDTPHPTFRHELVWDHAESLGVSGYKSDRDKRLDPAERARVLEQILTAEEMIDDVYGLPCFCARGFEGDDVVATWVQRALDAGMRAVAVTHDKDMTQLVQTDTDRVLVWDGRDKVLDAEGVEKKFGAGCWPDRVVDYLAITGDDGMKGILGAGPVAALKIVNAFPSLEEALVEAERGDKHPFWTAEPKLWAKVVSQQRQARLCRDLVTLRRDAPVSGTIADLVRRTSNATATALADREAEDDAYGALPAEPDEEVA